MEAAFSSSGYKRKRVQVEADEQPETSNIRKKGKNEKERKLIPPVAGKVSRIEMENFMCHESVKLNFEPNTVNCAYIVGPNGSGKSAIFAALNIGLGGAGKTNERGKSVQSYIMEGKEYTRIKIYLMNEGVNACSKFDKIVIVERYITQKNSTAKLKTCDANGGRERLVSDKRSDVNALLEQFNIELENPLAWLSQDRSRQFLQSMKPNKLYELYRKTSDMDSTDEVFQRVQTHYDEFKNIMNSMSAEKRAKEECYNQMKSRHDAKKLMGEKVKKHNRLLWYKLWAPIRDCENAIVSNLDMKEQALTKKTGSLAKKEQLTAERAQLLRHQDESKQLKDAALQKCRDQNTEDRELKRRLNELQFDTNDVEQQLRRKENSKNSIEKELEGQDKKLQELIGNSNRDVEGEKRQLEQARREVNEKIEELEREKRGLGGQLRPISAEFQERKKALQNHNADIAELEGRIGQLFEEKRIHEQSKHNRLAVFGPDIPRLMELIATNADNFKRAPIGPLGNYIKLKDQKWAQIVEFALRNKLDQFICDSAADRKALEELCNRNNIKLPQVTTVRFAETKYNTEGHEPPHKFLSVHRVLDVEHPTVNNALIDMVSVETILLFECDDEARRTLQQNPPENTKIAYTLEFGEVHPPRGRMPYRYYANNNKNFRARVLADRSAAMDDSYFVGEIQRTEQSLREKKTLQRELNEAFRAKEREMDSVRDSLQGIERRIEELGAQRFKAESKLQKLEQILLSGDQVENCHEAMRELRRQRDESIRQLDKIRKDLAHKRNEKEQVNIDMEKNSSRMAKLKNDVNQVEADIESFGLQLMKVEESLDKNEAELQKLDQLLRNYDQSLEELRRSLENDRPETEEASRKVTPEGEEDPPDFERIPETADLNRQSKDLEREIELNKNAREPVPTAEELLSYRDGYAKFKTSVKIWSNRFKKFEEMIENRVNKLAMLKNGLPQKLANKFEENMRMRNYEARLDVNDKDGMISINVETHPNANVLPGTDDGGCRSSLGKSERAGKRKIQDLKGLSGGERSFTTACFVMALWDCMESPFRCMDEFDVFMDGINRRIVMGMLVEMTMSHKEIQFFFFTPQSIKELATPDDNDSIKVYEMGKKDGIFNATNKD